MEGGEAEGLKASLDCVVQNMAEKEVDDSMPECLKKKTYCEHTAPTSDNLGTGLAND